MKTGLFDKIIQKILLLLLSANKYHMGLVVHAYYVQKAPPITEDYLGQPDTFHLIFY